MTQYKDALEGFRALFDTLGENPFLVIFSLSTGFFFLTVVAVPLILIGFMIFRREELSKKFVLWLLALPVFLLIVTIASCNLIDRDAMKKKGRETAEEIIPRLPN